MKVRDAVEADVPALAALADAPVSALRNLVHERSVRILVDDAEAPPTEGDDESSPTGQNPSAAGDSQPESDGEEAWVETTGDATAEGVHGFLSFDVREGTVHVTRFGGDHEAGERLLAEPLRFARAEGLPVEALVRQEDDALRDALEETGFEQVGAGPLFAGAPTERYRFDAE